MRPNGKRADLAQIFLKILIGFEFVSICWNIVKINAFTKAFCNSDTSLESMLRFYILGESAYFLMVVPLHVFAIVIVIRWFRRAYFNLHLKVPNLKYKEGWAAGAWFVPIVSFYKPYQIMKELHLETDRLLIQENCEGHKTNVKLLRLWLVFWVSIGVLHILMATTGLFVYGLFSEIIFDAITNAIVSLFQIPMLIMLLRLVKHYHHKEIALALIADNS